MPRVFGFGAGMAVLLSAANYTGGLKGNKDKEADEFARKEAMRMNRRRPIEETLADVGEGRCERYTPPHPPRKPVLPHDWTDTNYFQPSALPATRRGDESVSRSGTALTSRRTPPTPMLRKTRNEGSPGPGFVYIATEPHDAVDNGKPVSYTVSSSRTSIIRSCSQVCRPSLLVFLPVAPMMISRKRGCL